MKINEKYGMTPRQFMNACLIIAAGGAVIAFGVYMITPQNIRYDTNYWLVYNDSLPWGIAEGNNDDVAYMQYLFATVPRDGDCQVQTELMVKIARSAGIITRRINLWNGGSLPGHTTMEIYDRRTRQWVWCDPLYNVTAPMNLIQLQIAINRNECPIQLPAIWKQYLDPAQVITYVTP